MSGSELDIVIESLIGKNTPKRPITEKGTEYEPGSKVVTPCDCPNCGAHVFTHYNHCPECGQRLDWSR